MIFHIDDSTYILSNNIYYTNDPDLFGQILKSAQNMLPKSVRHITTSLDKKYFYKKDKLRDDILLSKSFSLKNKITFIADDSDIFLNERTRTDFDQTYGSPIVILVSNVIDIQKLHFSKSVEPVQQKVNQEKRKIHFNFIRRDKSHTKKHLSFKTLCPFLMSFVFGTASVSLFYGYGYLDVNTNIDAVYQYVGNIAGQSDNQYLHAYLDAAEPLHIVGENGANEIMRNAAGINTFTPYYFESRSQFRDVKYVPLYIEAVTRNNEPISFIFENGNSIDDISLISSGTDLGYCSPDDLDESSLSYNVFNRIALQRVYHIENDMFKNNSKTIFLPQQLIERVKTADESIESFVDQYVTIKIGEVEEQYIIANLLVDDYGHTPIFNDYLGDFAYMNLSTLNNYLYGRICFDPCSAYVNSESLVETSIVPYFLEGDTFVGYTYKDNTSIVVNEFNTLGELYNKKIYSPNENNLVLSTLFVISLLCFLIFVFSLIYFIRRMHINRVLSYLSFLLIITFLPLLFVDFVLSITQVALSHNFLSYLLYNSYGGLISFVTCLLCFIVCFIISHFIFKNSPLNKKRLMCERKVIKYDCKI